MNASPCSFVLCALSLGFVSAALAAPVAQVSCAAGGQSLNFDANSFDLGVTQTSNFGSAGGGAGVGKTVFEPLVIHTSFAPFQTLFNAATAGTIFESCTLTIQNSTGEVIELLLKPVLVSKVDATAQASTADAARTDIEVTLEYSSAQVNPSTNAAGIGGSSAVNDDLVKVKDRPSN